MFDAIEDMLDEQLIEELERRGYTIRALQSRVRELEAQQAVFLPIVRDVVKYGDCYWQWEHGGVLETQAGEIIDTIDRERNTV